MLDRPSPRLSRWVVNLLLIAAVLVCASCRTMEGLGEDVSHVGNKISSKAREKGAN